MKKLLMLSIVLILGLPELAFADDKSVGCDDGYFPKAKKENYYPCMWQVNKIVDLFGLEDKIFSSCFEKKDAKGKVIGSSYSAASKGMDGGNYYFTNFDQVGKGANSRMVSAGKRILEMESVKDPDGVEYWRVIDLANKPKRVVRLTKKGCYLDSFNLVDESLKGHTVSAETCIDIIKARNGKISPEGKASEIAEKKIAFVDGRESALRNCANSTIIGLMLRKNPPPKKPTDGSSGSGGSTGSGSRKAN